MIDLKDNLCTAFLYAPFEITSAQMKINLNVFEFEYPVILSRNDNFKI